MALRLMVVQVKFAERVLVASLIVGEGTFVRRSRAEVTFVPEIGAEMTFVRTTVLEEIVVDFVVAV